MPQGMIDQMNKLFAASAAPGVLILEWDSRSYEELCLSLEDGDPDLFIRTFYGGDGTPLYEWLGRRLVWTLATAAHGSQAIGRDELADLLDKLTPLIDRVAKGHSVEWDGSNYVGRLTDEAQDASDEMRLIIERTSIEDDSWSVWDAAEWLSNTDSRELGLTAGMDSKNLARIAEDIEIEAHNERVHLIGDVETVLEERLEELNLEAGLVQDDD